MNCFLDIIKRFELFEQHPAFQLRDRIVTYNRFLCDIEKLIGWCIRTNLHKGSVAILLLPSGYEFALSFFTMAALGVLVVPLNPSIREELIGILRHCKPTAIFLSANSAQKVKNFVKMADIRCNLIEIDLGESLLGGESVQIAINDISDAAAPDNDACILFTSGSSQNPKGVVLTQNGLIQSVVALHDFFNFNKGDRFLGIVPMFHGYGLTFSLLLPLWSGAQVMAFESLYIKRILDCCEKFDPTVIVGTPSIYKILIKATNHRSCSIKAKYCLTGGSELHGLDTIDFVNRTGRKLYNCYGSTETGTIFIKAIDVYDSVPYGNPLPAVKAKIIDEDGLEIDHGEVGEILIDSPWLMKGYYSERTETEKVVQNNWYHTGDLGKIDNKGNLVLYGRNSDMIKTREFKVYPKEIERVILQNPIFNDVIALGIDNESKGQAIYAAVELKNKDQSWSQKELKRFCKEKLTGYKIPRQIFCFTEFPRLPNGKINRNMIKQLILRSLRQNTHSFESQCIN
jgi:acyl-CoA synthetase (AMP-forming)/AMP-acid ligase II